MDMVEAYCKQFFGYGRWDAPVWFIGLEEAGAGTPQELQARLAVWDQRGRRELEDAPVFYPGCGQLQWHGPNASLQRTWRQLMRMLLLARNEPVGEGDLLAYQKQSLGAFSGHVCLAELSPLPARSQGQWPHAENENLPEWMRRRDTFLQAVLPGRIATLREKIAIHHPRAVVFCFWLHREFPPTRWPPPKLDSLGEGLRFQRTDPRKPKGVRHKLGSFLTSLPWPWGRKTSRSTAKSRRFAVASR